jgi:hypothetical protein
MKIINGVVKAKSVDHAKKILQGFQQRGILGHYEVDGNISDAIEIDYLCNAYIDRYSLVFDKDIKNGTLSDYIGKVPTDYLLYNFEAEYTGIVLD